MPTLPQVYADAHVVEDALLVLKRPQGAADRQARRNSLELAPAVETAGRVNCQLSQAA